MNLIVPFLLLMQCLRSSQLHLNDRTLIGCCHDVEYNPTHSSLVECVNVTLRRAVDAVISQVPYLQGQQGPRFALGIVTRVTPDIYDYAAYSLFVQSIYASVNNYALFPLYPDDTSTPDYEYHRKLVPLLNAMNSSDLGYHFDYVVWMDADVVPLDLNLRMESVAAMHPKAHVLMSADVSSIANTGVILVKNTLWAKKFLSDWLAEKSMASTDQQGLQLFLKKMMSREKDLQRIVFLPPSVLNSEAPPMGRQLDEHKILHLAAESTDMRQRAFRVAADDICETLTSGKETATQQLGVTRKTLQELSIVSYRYKAKSVLNMLISSPDEHATLPLVSDLKMHVSKYCHTLKYTNPGERENKESLVLRRRLHLLNMYIVRKLIASSECKASNDQKGGSVEDDLTAALFQRVQQLDMEASPTGDFILPEKEPYIHAYCVAKPAGFQYSDIPELLKISCEASYDYFHALASIDNQKTLPPSFHDALFGSEPTMKHLDPMYLVDHEKLYEDIITVRELRLSIARYIQNQLEKLMSNVKKSQANLVYDMQACLTSDIGLIKLEQGWVEDAIESFKEAIRLHSIIRNSASGSSSSSFSSPTSLSPMGGDRRAEFNSYSLLGSAYCMKHDHVIGLEYLEQAINMEIDHVGRAHHNLATKFVNAAVCAFEGFKDLSQDKGQIDSMNRNDLSKDPSYFLQKSHEHITMALEIITINEHVEVVRNLKKMAQEHLQEVIHALATIEIVSSI